MIGIPGEKGWLARASLQRFPEHHGLVDRRTGRRASELLHPGQVVGLGVAFEKFGQRSHSSVLKVRVQRGRHSHAVPTSKDPLHLVLFAVGMGVGEIKRLRVGELFFKLGRAFDFTHTEF